MKIKYTGMFIMALVTAFFTAQSFYYRFAKNDATSIKTVARHTPVCTPQFNAADSVADIPALKGWGNYSWRISTPTKDSVQFYFNQGISMYYGFHMIEAIASFTKATHIDPGCAMAWYGKALAMGPTINYPNGYVPPSDAYTAAVRCKALAANCSPIERTW